MGPCLSFHANLREGKASLAPLQIKFLTSGYLENITVLESAKQPEHPHETPVLKNPDPQPSGQQSTVTDTGKSGQYANLGFC